jgi:NAD(P)-dependent dehydrogenase (short-subunit alcohol dehydrogenase family)
VVAAGVADGGVTDAVGLVDGLLEDLRPGGTQRLEGLVQVVNLDEDRQVALGDNLVHRLPVGRRDVVVHSRQQQVVRVTGGMDGEPAHLRPHRDVVADLEAEPLGPETIEETGDRIRAAGGQGSALVVDHENPASVAGLLATVEREHGRLDMLVNDIFGGDRYAEWDKPLWEHDWPGGLRMLQMGVHTHLITCRAAIPLMLRTAAAGGTRGLVIEMTDGTSAANAEFRRRVGFYYDLVKANVERIVKGLSTELAGHPVTAVGVTPGWQLGLPRGVRLGARRRRGS